MNHIYTANLTIKSHQPDGFFCGYASVFHLKDQHGDIITPNAFKKSLEQWKAKESLPKLLWQHDQTQPIGVWHEIFEDNHGLFVKGQLLLELQQAREAYALLKAGIIDGMSIGFRPVKTRRYGKEQNRFIEEIDLQEISLVTFAANQQAKVTAVKTFNTEASDPLIERLRQLTHLIQETTA